MTETVFLISLSFAGLYIITFKPIASKIFFIYNYSNTNEKMLNHIINTSYNPYTFIVLMLLFCQLSSAYHH